MSQNTINTLDQKSKKKKKQTNLPTKTTLPPRDEANLIALSAPRLHKGAICAFPFIRTFIINPDMNIPLVRLKGAGARTGIYSSRLSAFHEIPVSEGAGLENAKEGGSERRKE